MKRGKRAAKVILIILGILILIVGVYCVYVLLDYDRLPDKLTLEVNKSGADSDFAEDFQVREGEEYCIMTYNIGFGAYTDDYSFFMDGGKSSWAKDKESVLTSVSAMGTMVSDEDPDFILIQEVDRDGTRSYHVDELEILNQFIKGYYYDFAQNYDSPFLFYPPWQPHGANRAGMVTYARGEIVEAMRRSFPISESLSKFVDLDRCYSISRVPTQNGKFLCIYNVHLSAYGSNDEIREGQLSMLFEDMTSDYEQGNYVICGGDYNHNVKKETVENAPEWAYLFPREKLPNGFHMAIDYAKSPEDIAHESCRSADQPYQEGVTYTVTLDGFITSDNVTVTDYQNMNCGYKYSDHDPVVMQFVLE
ncbi:MAG: endonuclease/exonuclease/phosphatase family protein [Lachnospiraceae bacterium]|nr:endonuclease/exonuclease/phosphatase family protein [Lachnospiraceae bacterium]